MCWLDGKWNEPLHQKTVDGVVRDLSEGRKGRGCVRKESSKSVLESNMKLEQIGVERFTGIEEAKKRLTEAAKL